MMMTCQGDVDGRLVFGMSFDGFHEGCLLTFVRWMSVDVFCVFTRGGVWLEEKRLLKESCKRWRCWRWCGKVVDHRGEGDGRRNKIVRGRGGVKFVEVEVEVVIKRGIEVRAGGIMREVWVTGLLERGRRRG